MATGIKGDPLPPSSSQPMISGTPRLEPISQDSSLKQRRPSVEVSDHSGQSSSRVDSPILTENPTPKSVDHSRAQRASLNLLMHRSNAKVFSVDSDGLIDAWSDAMIEFTGITVELALGISYPRVFTGENVVVVESIDQAKIGEDSQYKIMKVMSRRGRKRIVLNVLPRYGDQQTSIEGFACVIWDVSDLSDKEVRQLISIDKYHREDVDTMARDMQRLS